jgi:hypothetical protein
MTFRRCLVVSVPTSSMLQMQFGGISEYFFQGIFPSACKPLVWACSLENAVSLVFLFAFLALNGSRLPALTSFIKSGCRFRISRTALSVASSFLRSSTSTLMTLLLLSLKLRGFQASVLLRVQELGKTCRRSLLIKMRCARIQNDHEQ